MSVYIKELVIILVLSLPVFALSKPIALNFMEEPDFKRRRNIWLFLTVVGFLSSTFWWFVLVAAPTLYWGGRKDRNPLAFYLLLMTVIPPIPVDIPAIGVNRFFDLDIFRLLALCVIVPAAWRIRKNDDAGRIRHLEIMDFLLIGYGIIQIALYAPPDMPNHVILQNSFTNVLRTTFLFLVDVYALYYVASRSSSNRRSLDEALASFCLACTLMAAIAVFESLRHWLLYTDLNNRWGGNVLANQYFLRGGLLRAEASSGHPLALGSMLAIGLGFWLYLSRNFRRPIKLAVIGLLCAGLLVSLSRGPWLGAILIYFAYAILSPRGARRLIKALAAFVLISILVLISPIGKHITDSLPFAGGSVESSSLTYRERLFDRSVQLIEAHPLFGDQHAMAELSDLRQGQGIIDLVDAYVEVALFYGLVGLALFLAFILTGLLRAYRAAKRQHKATPDLALLGSCISACIAGDLLILADSSFSSGPEYIFFVLGALGTAYAHYSYVNRQSTATVAATALHKTGYSS